MNRYLQHFEFFRSKEGALLAHYVATGAVLIIVIGIDIRDLNEIEGLLKFLMGILYTFTALCGLAYAVMWCVLTVRVTQEFLSVCKDAIVNSYR